MLTVVLVGFDIPHHSSTILWLFRSYFSSWTWSCWGAYDKLLNIRYRTLVLGYQGWSVNAVVLVKLPKIPLLANKKSQIVHGISSLSRVMGLAAYKLRPVIGSVHELTLVPEYKTGRFIGTRRYHSRVTGVSRNCIPHTNIRDS